MTSLEIIEGIGKVNAQKLQAAGVTSIENLLEKGATRKGRQSLEEATGISGKTLLNWINKADLMRIKGVGGQYSELLEAGGVDSVMELAKRKPENLVQALEEANTKGKNRLVRQVPSLKQVQGWVEQAKTMERVVKH